MPGTGVQEQNLTNKKLRACFIFIYSPEQLELAPSFQELCWGMSGVGDTSTGPSETLSVDAEALERLSIILADLCRAQPIEFPLSVLTVKLSVCSFYQYKTPPV